MCIVLHGTMLLFLVTGRMLHAKRQTAGIKFTHRPKIRVFAPQGRLVAPIHVKFGMTKGHVGPLGHTKFNANRFMCGNEAPKYQKFPLLVESPRRGEPLDRFLKFYGILHAQLSYTCISNLT